MPPAGGPDGPAGDRPQPRRREGAKDRRLRRLRAEARLRALLVRDSSLLAAHRGGPEQPAPTPGAQPASEHSRTPARLAALEQALTRLERRHNFSMENVTAHLETFEATLREQANHARDFALRTNETVSALQDTSQAVDARLDEALERLFDVESQTVKRYLALEARIGQVHDACDAKLELELGSHRENVGVAHLDLDRVVTEQMAGLEHSIQTLSKDVRLEQTRAHKQLQQLYLAQGQQHSDFKQRLQTVGGDLQLKLTTAHEELQQLNLKQYKQRADLDKFLTHVNESIVGDLDRLKAAIVGLTTGPEDVRLELKTVSEELQRLNRKNRDVDRDLAEFFTYFNETILPRVPDGCGVP